jgi:hypothetical protein
MIYAALTMALIGQLWFLIVAWRESKLLVGIIIAPTVMAYLMQTGLVQVSKITFFITAGLAGLVVIGFAIYHFELTWMPVLMILGGNVWFHQQGGLKALKQDVDDKKSRIKKKDRDADDDEEAWRRYPWRGRALAQKDISMPASCSLRRASPARRQGPMATAPSTVPASASMGTRVAMSDTKPEARENRTQAPIPSKVIALSAVPPRAAQLRVLKIFTAKNTAAMPRTIMRERNAAA